MKLRDLPKEIQDLVVKRVEEQGERVMYDHPIDLLFFWNRTVEGFDFWDEIRFGNFDVYYKKYGATKSKEERLEERLNRLEKNGDKNMRDISDLFGNISELDDDVAKLFNRLEQRIKKLEDNQEFEKVKDEIWQNIKMKIGKEEKIDEDEFEDINNLMDQQYDPKPQKYYQIGQRFQYETLRVETEPYILALVGDCKAVLISLKTGRPWKHPVEIKLPGVVDKHEAIEVGINDMKKL